MSVVVTHTRVVMANGVQKTLRAADDEAVGVILQNLGRGQFVYTIDGSVPSGTNGLTLGAGETFDAQGIEWADTTSGESFLKEAILGLFGGGSDAGGADPDEALVNVVGFAQVP